MKRILLLLMLFASTLAMSQTLTPAWDTLNNRLTFKSDTTIIGRVLIPEIGSGWINDGAIKRWDSERQVEAIWNPITGWEEVVTVRAKGDTLIVPLTFKYIKVGDKVYKVKFDLVDTTYPETLDDFLRRYGTRNN